MAAGRRTGALALQSPAMRDAGEDWGKGAKFGGAKFRLATPGAPEHVLAEWAGAANAAANPSARGKLNHCVCAIRFPNTCPA